jgi:hypothetical protein
MDPINHRSLITILRQSFDETLAAITTQEKASINVVERTTIEAQEFKTVICSIASSTFKMNMLLHYSNSDAVIDSFFDTIKSDIRGDKKNQYQDYISELVNNLCGTANRILGYAGFSSGMSTPATLNISNSTKHMEVIAPDSEVHIGCFLEGEPLFFGSLYLFINKGFESSLILKIPEAVAECEASGELEFF